MAEGRTPMFPRDSAGSFTVPATKEGAIQCMVSLDNFLEIYTSEETFIFQTPESFDPERTNPNAMFVNAKTADVGSASPFVARTILMANEMLNGGFLLDKARREQLMMLMHRIKNSLVQSSQAADAYQLSVRTEIEAFTLSNSKKAQGGRSLDKFPVVPDIEAKLTAFLIPARRVITEVCQIPTYFWPIKRSHSDPENLLKKELIPLLGEDHRMILWLNEIVGSIKHVIDLRNGQEHSSTTKGRALIFKNFHMLPSNQVHIPVWFLDGGNPTDISDEMAMITATLLQFAEVMFIASIDANLPEFPPMFLTHNDKPDPNCPVMYKLVIDHTKFQFPLKSA